MPHAAHDRARVARRLLSLARGDTPLLPRVRRVIPITRETLAMMLGVTRQTLALELKGIAATGGSLPVIWEDRHRVGGQVA